MMSAEPKVPVSRRGPAKGARRRSRELAVQGVYQWLLNEIPASGLLAQLRETNEHEKAEDAYLSTLILGVTSQAAALRQMLSSHLDRDAQQLSPVEHAILLLGAFELAKCPEVPYRVVINEAVELGKVFGGTDGHKYINGVLDRLAPKLRPSEVTKRREPR